MKLIKIIIIVLFFNFFAVNSYSQTIKNKYIEASISYALIGEGDYDALKYSNSFSEELNKVLTAKIKISSLWSSDFRQDIENLNNYHNIFHLNTNFNLMFVPINYKYFKFSFGGGGAIRYRNEIMVRGYETYYDDFKIYYNTAKRFDLGFNLETTLDLFLINNFGFYCTGQFESYNKGSSYFSIGGGIKYKF